MRVAGVTIPKQKRVVIGLTYVFGVGSTTAEKILENERCHEASENCMPIKDILTLIPGGMWYEIP